MCDHIGNGSLATVSRNLGNGVKDAIKRLSQASNGESPDHTPNLLVHRLKPQISIEQVDWAEEVCSKESTLCLESTNDKLSVNFKRAKANSLPMGLSLEQPRMSESPDEATSEFSDELESTLELESSMDIDKEFGNSPKMHRNGPRVVKKQALKQMDSVSSSVMGSDSEMSSDDELNGKEIDDEVFTLFDADEKNLIEWASKEFIPSCQTLLQHCAVEDNAEKASQIQYQLRNLSNRINYFCTEQQRLSGQLKAFLLRGITASISTDQFNRFNSIDKSLTLTPLQPNTSSDTPPGSGRESGESYYDHRSYAVKVLRSVSQSLIEPLLFDAQEGFTKELYQAIVQALQKIAWKVEACLSFNDPTKQFQIHSKIFTPGESERVKVMMIGVLPPEGPNLQTTAGSRSSSASDPKSSDSSPREGGLVENKAQRVVKRTPSGRVRPSGTVFDSATLPDNFKLMEKSDPASNKPGSGETTPLATSLESTPKIMRSRTATLGDGDITSSWKSQPLYRYGSSPYVDRDGFPIPTDFTPDYLRPKKARRTTVSLSRKEVTSLGLTVAKRVDETIVTDTSGGDSCANEEEVRERLHAKLTEDFNKIRGSTPPQGPYIRTKSASMSDLLDDESPPSVAKRHDSDPRRLSEVGPTDKLASPGPYSPNYSKSYTVLRAQKSESMIHDHSDWVLVKGKQCDPRVARGSPTKSLSVKSAAVISKGKKSKKQSHKKTANDKGSTSGRFSVSLRKTAQALRRMSSSVPKSSRTSMNSTVEVRSLDLLTEVDREPPRPSSALALSEPTSPTTKTRGSSKSDTMPGKRKIGTFFRGSKPQSKSFSKADSLVRKRKNHKSGFLEGYGDVPVGGGGFSESIDLLYSEQAGVERAVQQEAEKELLITVGVAGKQPTKGKRLSTNGSWFEITVTTNIKQFGRNHYTILRTVKQVQSLFDELHSSYAHKLPERPDKKKDVRKQVQQVQDFFRFVSGNPELRESGPFVMFLMPDDEFGTFTDTGSEVNFELIMTFYTPDHYPGPPGSHRDVEVVLPEDTPLSHPTATPSPTRTRRGGTLKRGTLHVMKSEGKEEGSTFVIREEDKDALIVACEDDRYVVVAGTFEKLVEQLACEEKPDPRFVSTLLLGYRHFATPVELLTGLLRRFHLELPPDATDEEIVYAEKWRYVIQLRVLDILTYWIKKCWPDFYRYQEMLEQTNQFIGDLKASTDQNFNLAGTNLDKIVAEKTESSSRLYSLTTPNSPTRTPSAPGTPTRSSQSPSTPNTPTLRGQASPTHTTRGNSTPSTPTLRSRGESASPLLPVGGRSPTRGHPVDISTLTAIQLARQLTLIELEFLKLITTHELAVYTWEPNNPENKPYRKNLDNFIARFNKVSYWVASEICSVQDARSRGALIEKFIEIAKQCQEHRNFNTTISLVSGLSLAAVRRLKKSWEFVGEKSAKTYQKLTSVTSPTNNHGYYRKLLANAHRRDTSVPYFCIPYFGVFIRDLTFFNDGNTKRLKNGLINFSKLRTMVLKFEEMKRYQRSKYFFPPEDKTRGFCRNLWSYSESDLYEASLQREPREPAPTAPETDV